LLIPICYQNRPRPFKTRSKTSKATRAYAIKTLKEQGFPTDDEALIERTIEEYRVFRREFFASDKADHAAILEYASGKW
jgi:hypothetical protein